MTTARYYSWEQRERRHEASWKLLPFLPHERYVHVCVCTWHLNGVSSFFIPSQLSAGGVTLAFYLQEAANSCVWCDACHTHVALPNDGLARV